MWRKGAQQNRLKALRVEAASRMAASPLTTSAIWMTICVYAHPGKGDLDNFITGSSLIKGYSLLAQVGKK